MNFNCSYCIWILYLYFVYFMLLTTFDYFFELTIQKSVILTSRESLVTFNNETKCEIDKILLINLEV